MLEFLLARYCASDEPDEVQAGLEAVLATLQDNYVRPDEANAAQSRVATASSTRCTCATWSGRSATGPRWRTSTRIAVAEKFYRDSERLLEGGIWAEVTVAYSEIDADDYAFYVEDLRPIQLSRFDFNGYMAGRCVFNRNQWLDAGWTSTRSRPVGMRSASTIWRCGAVWRRRWMYFDGTVHSSPPGYSALAPRTAQVLTRLAQASSRTKPRRV